MQFNFFYIVLTGKNILSKCELHEYRDTIREQEQNKTKIKTNGEEKKTLKPQKKSLLHE